MADASRSNFQGFCMKKASMIMVAALVLSGLMLYSSMGQAEYQKFVGDYSSYEYTAYPEPWFPYPVINYSVSRSSSFVRLFDEIAIDDFASGIPYQNTSTTKSHTDDFGQLVIHETPASAFEFRALADNSVSLFLSDDTGALRSGRSVVIGNENAKGYVISRGDVNVTIGSDEVTFDVAAGASIIFRADPEGEQVIGEATSNGRVGGEMYITTKGGLLVEDIVLYDKLDMQTVAPGNREIDLAVSGESIGATSIVIHVDRDMLAYDSPEDIGILMDETYIERGTGLSETLYSEAEAARYYVSEAGDGYDVVIYFPDIQTHKITIGSVQEDIGIDGFATFLSAVAIVGIAAAALVYNKE